MRHQGTRSVCKGLIAAFLGSLLANTVQAAPGGPPAVGDKAESFTLKSIDDQTVALSDLNSKGPVVLVVLRGFPGYQCPICSRQVAELRSKSDAFRSAGARVVLVYPGPSDELQQRAKEFLGGNALPDPFVMLIDPDYVFTNQYKLRWDAPRETAYPSTFVLDRTGTIRFAKVSKTHGDRASTADILDALKKAEAARP
jgi:thioredoxin-dependent peroxiredoxin